jgi:glutathione peroxidase
MSVYEFSVLNRDGDEVSLDEFKDKVLLIINSATQCGFTPQYDKLQDLYERYNGQGFAILDFPCNQFGNQAPGTDSEIASFCDAKFGVTFPIYSKIEVNGENAAPLFQYLVKQKGFQGFDLEHPLTAILQSMLERNDPNSLKTPDIKWNFTKFLVDRQGNVVERFEPTTEIDVIEDKVKELL